MEQWNIVRVYFGCGGFGGGGGCGGGCGGGRRRR